MKKGYYGGVGESFMVLKHYYATFAAKSCSLNGENSRFSLYFAMGKTPQFHFFLRRDGQTNLLIEAPPMSLQGLAECFRRRQCSQGCEHRLNISCDFAQQVQVSMHELRTQIARSRRMISKIENKLQREKLGNTLCKKENGLFQYQGLNF